MIHSLRSVHNVTQGLVLRCVTFELTQVAMQREARIDSDSILTFLCVALLPLFLICVSQCKALRHHCEPTFMQLLPIYRY